MGFERVDSFNAKLVDGIHIFDEHIWMLVIPGGYVLADCGGELCGVGSPERKEEDIAVSLGSTGNTRSYIEALTMPSLRVTAELFKKTLYCERLRELVTSGERQNFRRGPDSRL